MNIHETLSYVEIPSNDLEKTKTFFSTVFNWEFKDFGSEYTCWETDKLNGGFYYSDKKSVVENGSSLLIFYSDSLADTKAKILECGGKISKPDFEFPGGKRFHFIDTTGNEFGVWSIV